MSTARRRPQGPSPGVRCASSERTENKPADMATPALTAHMTHSGTARGKRVIGGGGQALGSRANNSVTRIRPI